jgi:hypothetical protein
MHCTRGSEAIQCIFPRLMSKPLTMISPQDLSEGQKRRRETGDCCFLSSLSWAQPPSRQQFGSTRKQVINPEARKISVIQTRAVSSCILLRLDRTDTFRFGSLLHLLKLVQNKYRVNILNELDLTLIGTKEAIP